MRNHADSISNSVVKRYKSTTILGGGPPGKIVQCRYKAPLRCERGKQAARASSSVSLAAHLQAADSTHRRMCKSRSGSQGPARDAAGRTRPAWWAHFTQAPRALRRTARGAPELEGGNSPPCPPATAEVWYFLPEEPKRISLGGSGGAGAGAYPAERASAVG